MATVTGLTAERMLEIEAASIVDGDIVGDDLILERHDGSTINAGVVRGAQGPIGPAGLDLSALPTVPILDVGVAGQIRAGRVLSLADFNTLCELPTVPVGLYRLGDVNNLGGAPALTNKGGVAFGSGLTGASPEAAIFTGQAAQALYIADTGGGDPLRVTTGSWGCWFRTAKRDTPQGLIAKYRVTGNQLSFFLSTNTVNAVRVLLSTNGSGNTIINGITDVCDDRWHFVVVTYDGTIAKVYVDGKLDVSSWTINGPLFSSSGPFNIGSADADASTAALSPMFGRITQAFVIRDILTEDQVRLLYCAKIPHALTIVPKHVILNVKRRRLGPILAVADFPAQPARLYNLNNLNDLGSNNVPLTANAGTGVLAQISGPDGSKDTARSYSGAHNGDSGTDAGLPAALTSRSLGCWVKTNFGYPSAVGPILEYGGAGTTELLYITNGEIRSHSQAADRAVAIGSAISDGFWHHVVVVEDNTAADGLKSKIYVDGILRGSSTTLGSITLGGANRFRIGARADGTTPFTGQIARVFVHAGALTVEQVLSIMYKSSQDLGFSPKNPGDHIEALDVTNIYAIFDSLEGQHQIDMAVAV